MKQLMWLFCFTGILAGMCSCTGCSPLNVKTNTVQKKEISVVSYNAQEFFDGKRDGCEYSDYKKSSGWGVESYKVRLERLCTLIRTLDADVFVLQEIENEGILQDISNFLSGASWKQKDLWTYSCFAKEPGTAIGNAVISKLPLENIKVHGLDIRSENEDQPVMRPVLEAEVLVGEKRVQIFANHWKSKSGGKEETELWRNWQEKQLADILEKNRKEKANNFSVLICGDFNRDIFDFSLASGNDGLNGTVKFRGEDAEFCVFSPWITENGKETTATGSYWYDEKWERIDQIFYCGEIKLKYFGPQTAGEWADEKGIPKGYKLYTGEGYSDHLPLKAVFEIVS